MDEPQVTPQADSAPELPPSREPVAAVSAGWGYGVLVVANVIAIVMSLPLIYAIGDSYAGFVVFMYGVPLLVGQFAIGLLPAIIYCAGNSGRVVKSQLNMLLVLSIGASLVVATCIALDLMLPTTHGGHC